MQQSKSRLKGASNFAPVIALTIVVTVLLSIVLLTAVDRSVRTESVTAASTASPPRDLMTVPLAPQQPSGPTADQIEAQRQADEAARRQSSERAEQEAQERVRREAEERARREAEERARREAEERARQDAQQQLEDAAKDHAARVTPELANAAANIDVLAEAQTHKYAEEGRCWQDDSLEYIEKLQQCLARGVQAYEDFRADPGSYHQERYDFWYPQYYEATRQEFIRYYARR